MFYGMQIYLGVTILFALYNAPAVKAAVKVIHLHDTAVWSLDNEHGYQNVSLLRDIHVPSYALEVLADKGILGDPLYRYNEREFLWVAHDNWTFTASWYLPSKVKRYIQRVDGAVLCLDGVDTAADVFLNGVWLGTIANSHKKHLFNVANLLENENELKIVIYSSVPYSINAAHDYPYEVPHTQQLGSIGKYNFIRKAASDFGWDWGPAFAPIGIAGNVSLFLRDEPLIFDVGIGQEHHSNGSISLTIDCFFLPTSEYEEGRVEVVVSTVSPDNRSGEGSSEDSWNSDLHVVFPQTQGSCFSSQKTGLCGKPDRFQLSYSDLVRRTIHLYFPPPPNIRLWWPWDLAIERNVTSASALYKATVSYIPCSIFARHQISIKTQVLERKFGFRTVALERKPLVDGETFRVLINGVPMYARGANVIPMHILETKVDSGKIKDLIGSSRAANMNMLRVWGGGRYFKDAFYDEMDKAGLLVWQEFAFACAMYPRDELFLKQVREEVQQQSVRLMHHPSIVVWGGNNENEAAFEWFVESRDNQKLYAVDYAKLFLDTIRDSLMSVNPQAIYVDSSPSNSIIPIPGNSKFDNQDPLRQYVKRWGDVSHPLFGDVHYYNYKDDLLNENNLPDARFVSEFGYLSFASLGAYSKQTSPSLDWSVDSDMTRYRMRHGGGVQELKAQIEALYGCSPGGEQSATPYAPNGTLPCAAIVSIIDFGKPLKCMQNAVKSHVLYQSQSIDEFQAFVYLTQLHQALVYSTAASKWRRGKYSFGNGGFLYWQLNDVWAGPSWSSINHDGSWRAIHHAASNFFAPVTVFGTLKRLEPCQECLGALDVWLVNDFSTSVQGSLTVQLIDYKAKSLEDVITLMAETSVIAPASNATLAWHWEDALHNFTVRNIDKAFVRLEFCPHENSTRYKACAVCYLPSTKPKEFTGWDTILEVISVQNCNNLNNNNHCFSLVISATGGIAPWVLLESTILGRFSDNLLFIFPWEETRIEFYVSPSVTVLPSHLEMKESLRVSWFRGKGIAVSLEPSMRGRGH